jgi:hypothetical protein
VQLAARLFVGLFVLIAGLGVGARWLFTPDAVAAEMGIGLDGPIAYNQVRGDMGGVFVALAVVCAYGLFRSRPEWLRAGAVLTAGVVLGRAFGTLMNGFAPEIGVAMLVESLAVAALVYCAQSMESERAH